MARKLKEDTKQIKSDLDEILNCSEQLLNKRNKVLHRVAEGFALTSKVYKLYDDCVQLRDEVKKDSSVSSNNYLADAIRECTNYFATTLIRRYVK